jgi:hypothetical protein
MSITKLLYGLAALPLIAGVASAETPKSTAVSKKPAQLNEKQMDKVTAGWRLLEIDTSNTSWTLISVYSGGLPPVTVGTSTTPVASACPNCYLSLSSPALSIYSAFGPGNPLVAAP